VLLSILVLSVFIRVYLWLKFAFELMGS